MQPRIYLQCYISFSILYSLEVKSAGNESAVLCSNDKSYNLQLVEISNSMLLVPAIGGTAKALASAKLSERRSALDSPGPVDQGGGTIEVVDLCHEILELRRQPPEVGRLQELLSRSVLDDKDPTEVAGGGDSRALDDDALWLRDK